MPWPPAACAFWLWSHCLPSGSEAFLAETAGMAGLLAIFFIIISPTTWDQVQKKTLAPWNFLKLCGPVPLRYRTWTGKNGHEGSQISETRRCLLLEGESTQMYSSPSEFPRERGSVDIRHCSKCAELIQLSLSHSLRPLGVLPPASRWAENDFISTNKHPNYVIMGWHLNWI